MDTFLIYTPQITQRIDYIFTHIFFKILKIEFGITKDLKEFNEHSGAKLCYTDERVGKSFWIKPSGLLHEKGISDQNIQVSEYEGLKVFFRIDEKCDLPFDIFSASFFLLSRYEEYLAESNEKNERFEAIQSIAYLHGFLYEPLVDKWILLLKSVLIKKYPELECPSKWD